MFSVLKVDAVTPSADTIKNDIKKEFFKEHSRLKSILQVIFQLFFFFKKKIIIINILFNLFEISSGSPQFHYNNPYIYTHSPL